MCTNKVVGDDQEVLVEVALVADGLVAPDHKVPRPDAAHLPSEPKATQSYLGVVPVHQRVSGLDQCVPGVLGLVELVVAGVSDATLPQAHSPSIAWLEAEALVMVDSGRDALVPEGALPPACKLFDLVKGVYRDLGLITQTAGEEALTLSHEPQTSGEETLDPSLLD